MQDTLGQVDLSSSLELLYSDEGTADLITNYLNSKKGDTSYKDYAGQLIIDYTLFTQALTEFWESIENSTKEKEFLNLINNLSDYNANDFEEIL